MLRFVSTDKFTAFSRLPENRNHKQNSHAYVAHGSKCHLDSQTTASDSWESPYKLRVRIWKKEKTETQGTRKLLRKILDILQELCSTSKTDKFVNPIKSS